MARIFLKIHGIPFELSKENKKYETHEIAAMARGYTVYIERKISGKNNISLPTAIKKVFSKNLKYFFYYLPSLFHK